MCVERKGVGGPWSGVCFLFCLFMVVSPLTSGGLGIAVLLVLLFLACSCSLFSADHEFSEALHYLSSYFSWDPFWICGLMWEKVFLCCEVLLQVHIGFCPLKFFENLCPKAAFDRSCVINLKQSLPASPQLV